MRCLQSNKSQSILRLSLQMLSFKKSTYSEKSLIRIYSNTSMPKRAQILFFFSFSTVIKEPWRTSFLNIRKVFPIKSSEGSLHRSSLLSNSSRTETSFIGTSNQKIFLFTMMALKSQILELQRSSIIIIVIKRQLLSQEQCNS